MRVIDFQTIYSIIFIKIDPIENCYLLINFNIMYLYMYIVYGFIHTIEIKSKNNVFNLN